MDESLRKGLSTIAFGNGPLTIVLEKGARKGSSDSRWFRFTVSSKPRMGPAPLLWKSLRLWVIGYQIRTMSYSVDHFSVNPLRLGFFFIYERNWRTETPPQWAPPCVSLSLLIFGISVPKHDWATCRMSDHFDWVEMRLLYTSCRVI